MESAFKHIGLGTRTTYDDASRPWKLDNDSRLEIDRLSLTYRLRDYQLDIGKQTYPLGILDGIQVTDRFDAVRYREAIFIDDRPQRIGRWGARQTFKWDKTGLELIISHDSTVNQQAMPGSAFAVSAPRFLGGITAQTGSPVLPRITLPKKPSFAGKFFWESKHSDFALVAFRAPQQQALWSSDQRGVRLSYPTTELFGANFQHARGGRVWRLEAAILPRQDINVEPNQQGLRHKTTSQGLLGVGTDWRFKGYFFNAQIMIDHLYRYPHDAIRPRTDTIATLKVKKRFLNDRLALNSEYIGSLGDGDGVVRSSVAWQSSDQLELSTGIDNIWGASDELIGQFEEESRIWIKAKIDL